MSDLLSGLVISATRRHVSVAREDWQVFSGKVGQSKLDICVGDKVLYRCDNEEIIVEDVIDRKNCLSRSYGRKSKQLVANVDLVVVVTAPKPLFNTTFIDRALVAAHSEGMPVALVVNKRDLAAPLAETEDNISTYKNLGYKVVRSSAKEAGGDEKVKAMLSDPSLAVVCFVGVSGVGKSSLLNKLVPDAEARTSHVGAKTGQGRQTTSHALGYKYEREDRKPFLLVDLPGIQNFGLSHLEEAEIRDRFVEFKSMSAHCKFSNCTHRVEPECAVVQAIQEGKIASSRYHSYLNILEELESISPY